MARDPKSTPKQRVEARVILLAAQARSNQDIAQELDLQLADVDRLRERFARCRLHALVDERPPGLLDQIAPAPEPEDMAPSAVRVGLTGSERRTLQRIVNAHKSEQRIVLRAKVVLLAAQGRNNTEIAEELGCDVQTVRKWRGRYARDRLEGLYDMPRSGRPFKFEATQRCEAIAVLLQQPPPPFSAWTLDMAVEALLKRQIVQSISRETLSRWLRTGDIKPHRCKYWLHSKDPEFKQKMAAIVNLYINKPKDGRVICIDEKTCIPARERRHPDKPMKSGRARRLEYEYKRHGTVHLIAAFDVHSGRVIGECIDKNDSAAFIRFLYRLRRKYRDEKLYLILDNGTTHRSKDTTKFLARHPWFGTPVFTPTHASWLNQIEIWFSALSRQALRHASFASRDELAGRILDYIWWHNQSCKPYRWTATGEALCA